METVTLSDGQTKVSVKNFARITHLKRVFEEAMIEARKWSDLDLWNKAAHEFKRAARAAQDVAKAVSLYEIRG